VVLLFDHLPRRGDELGLPAGARLHLLDSTEPDWWRLRCCSSGQVGFLPAGLLLRVHPGERTHRALQPCALLGPGGEVGRLHQDQVVVELPPDLQPDPDTGLVTVRTADQARGEVPLRYLSGI